MGITVHLDRAASLVDRVIAKLNTKLPTLPIVGMTSAGWVGGDSGCIGPRAH